MRNRDRFDNWGDAENYYLAIDPFNHTTADIKGKVVYVGTPGEMPVSNELVAMYYGRGDNNRTINMDFQTRLLTEQAELRERFNKLSAFIGTGDFTAIEPEQQKLLKEQLTAMDTYLRIIDARVANLKIDPAATRELTFGEKAVGITFSPGKNEKVESIKRKFADVIDELQELRTPKGGAMVSSDVARMASVAITEAQSAQMWGVKAATWQY